MAHAERVDYFEAGDKPQLPFPSHIPTDIRPWLQELANRNPSNTQDSVFAPRFVMTDELDAQGDVVATFCGLEEFQDVLDPDFNTMMFDSMRRGNRHLDGTINIGVVTTQVDGLYYRFGVRYPVAADQEPEIICGVDHTKMEVVNHNNPPITDKVRLIAQLTNYEPRLDTVTQIPPNGTFIRDGVTYKVQYIERPGFSSSSSLTPDDRAEVDAMYEDLVTNSPPPTEPSELPFSRPILPPYDQDRDDVSTPQDPTWNARLTEAIGENSTDGPEIILDTFKTRSAHPGRVHPPTPPEAQLPHRKTQSPTTSSAPAHITNEALELLQAQIAARGGIHIPSE